MPPLEPAGAPTYRDRMDKPQDALDEARRLVPGADVHALAAEWEHVWTTTGRPALKHPDRAFLGWVRKRLSG